MTSIVSARNVSKAAARDAKRWFGSRGVWVKITHDGVTTIEVVSGDKPAEILLDALKIALRYDPENWEFKHTEFKIIPC